MNAEARYPQQSLGEKQFQRLIIRIIISIWMWTLTCHEDISRSDGQGTRLPLLRAPAFSGTLSLVLTFFLLVLVLIVGIRIPTLHFRGTDQLYRSGRKIKKKLYLSYRFSESDTIG
jgi:hypothetical protein